MKPRIIFLRGLPCSGKSTLAKRLSNLYKWNVISPDNINFSNSAFKKLLKQIDNEASANLKFIKYLYNLNLAEKYLHDSKNVIWEQPWSKGDGLKKTILNFKTKGIISLDECLIINITIPFNISEQRVIKRYEKKPKSISPQALINDFKTIFENEIFFNDLDIKILQIDGQLGIKEIENKIINQISNLC